MNYDRKLTISIGNSRMSKQWTAAECMWSEFIEKLRTPQRTAELYEEYLRMGKAQQGALKDIGGMT